MKLLSSIIALFVLTIGYAQVTVCLGTDATVCQGQTVEITNCGGAGGGSTGGVFLNAPTSVALTDDSWTPLIPMGMSFNFYGSSYSNIVIGSNGIVSFNAANASAYCAWSLSGTPLPSSSVAQCNNSLMVAHQDLNPSNGTSGPIQYQLLGTAPNRQFVILYNGVTMFSCTNSCAYIGYIFYETSNVVEMFIGEKGSCPAWNGGLAIQGTQNNPGAVAHTTPGRNNSVWTANMDGKRWMPTSPLVTTNYTISTIPYVNINAPGGNLQWQNTLGQSFPYNSGVLQVNLVPPGTTGYFLTGTSCGVSVGSVSDTTFITRVSTTANATATTDYCAGGNGSATANPLMGTPPFTYAWTPTGQTSQTATNLVTGPYQVVVTSADGCSATVNITVPNSSASYSTTSTSVSCPGGNDGTATATMTPALGTVSYNWYDAGGQTTQTAVGLSAGTYNCEVSSSVGCIDTVMVTITEIPGMIATIVAQQNTTCNSGSDGIIAVDVTLGTGPYTYSWDNSSSTIQAANDLAAGTHTVTITDANGCVISVSGTIGEPVGLSFADLSPNLTICPENDTILFAQGAGGSSPYIYTWTENGTLIGVGDTIGVDPSLSGTTYCVTLSEVCGSPTVDTCLTIIFPVPIVPLFSPDIPSACEPGTFVFTNNSNNPSEIDNVFFEFGDGDDVVLMGSAGTSHTYTDPESYDVNATVTSIYGCVYVQNFPNIVTVIANPTANFNMSANPTTIFETTVGMQNSSSSGVVSWEWYSPNSIPTNSTLVNPTFNFPIGVISQYPIQLIVTTPEGCKDTVEHILTVNSDIMFFAPNSFTPNGDEYNNTWSFSVLGVDEYNFELLIFNRWGEIVWETRDIHSEWDGSYKGVTIPTGQVTWVARVKDVYTDEKREFTGSINILR